MSRVTPSVPSQSPRHSWTMWSTAEVYWQKENHHKVGRKEQGAPPTTQCPGARCTAARKHMHVSVHILRTPRLGVRYTARKGRPACGVNNALISTAGEPSGWRSFSGGSQVHHAEDLEDVPACSLSASNLQYLLSFCKG